MLLTFLLFHFYTFLLKRMKPKIVILSAFASPLRSGAEACAEEVPAVLHDQYDFTIVTARMRRDLPKKAQLQGIPVVRVGFGCTFDKWLFPFLAPFVVRRLQPDIIHAVLETFAGLALHFCKFITPKAKRMLTLQTTNRSFLKATLIKSPDAITAISRTLQDIASRYRADVVHIPNGMHLSQIPQATKVENRILFAGRLEPMKGIDTLLQACSYLHEDYQLHIVGDGSERHALQALARSLGIQDKVKFLGFIPVPDVYQEFAEAAIFCGLSRSEALGNVFFEAQAAGCAVVGTAIGGIPDIITDDVNGILVPPDYVEAATNVLQELLVNGIKRSTLASNGKKNASQYDWSIIAEKYSELYQKVLG